MILSSVDTVSQIDVKTFREDYYLSRKPLVIKDLSKQWPALNKWNWTYFKTVAGDKKVGIFDNYKKDKYTPVNTASAFTTFGEYLDMISAGPAGWRIFLFNIFDHAPQLREDFSWPDHLMKGFIKRLPMLFVGGETSITHMHFDIDLSHIMHTQFVGRKRILLFPFEERHKLYRKPFEVLSLVDFSNYYKKTTFPDSSQFPAINLAKGYEVILEHGDTLFMPAGYWHHMEYLESGFAMSLRAMQTEWGGKLRGLWNLVGMRNIDTLMKKTAPDWWNDYKTEKTMAAAQKVMDEYLTTLHPSIEHTYTTDY